MGNEFSNSTTGLPSELPTTSRNHVQYPDCWQTELDTRPTSLAECIDDDGLKPFSYIRYCQRRSDESESLAQFLESVLHAPLEDDDDDDEAAAIAIAKPPKKRAMQGSVLDYVDENGRLVSSSPTETPWYRMYVASDPTKVRSKHNRQEKKFRRRFRLPYQNYKDLVEKVKAAPDIFGRWMKPQSSPIELLVLGALRYLGRAFVDFIEPRKKNEILDLLLECRRHLVSAGRSLFLLL
jgi:hypothetical protein